LEPLADFEAQEMSALTLEEQEVLLSATGMFTDRLKELLESHQVKEHVK
jgi:aspartate aminotransferase-like enzyme